MKYYTILPLEPKWKYNPTIPQDYKVLSDLWWDLCFDLVKGKKILIGIQII